VPQTVVFFNHEWVEIGTRCTFNQLISCITGIDGYHLEERVEEASTAQKFSWASKRQTLRTEDTAYCLTGLFGVNMLLLYGEGSQAFIRLQLEIMKVSDDESLFAWTDGSIRSTFSQTTGLLANSPMAFQHSGDIVSSSHGHGSTIPYSMTNKGLNISFTLMPAAEAWQRGVPVDKSEAYPLIPDYSQSFAPLNCYIPAIPSIEDNHILLRLARGTNRNGNEWCARLCSTRLLQLPSSAIPVQQKKERIFVREISHIEPSLCLLRSTSKFQINAQQFFSIGYSISSLIDSGSELTIGVDNVITSRRRPVSTDREGAFILELGTNEEESIAFVEFKSPNSGLPETFVLQIYQDPDDWRIEGIVLLLPTSKSLDERMLEARRDRPFTRCDRTTIKLPSGREISAALKEQARDGESMYAVDFKVKSFDSLNLYAKPRL
jgi:hypothetical protein